MGTPSLLLFGFNILQLGIISFVIFVVALGASYYRTGNKVGLSHLPGPWIAKYSNAWRIWNANSGRAPQNFQELHRKYGKIVRIGPSHVSISSPELVPVIYGISSNFIKSPFYNTFVPLVDGKSLYSLFSTQNQSHHRTLKSGIAQKYSLSALVKLEPLVDQVTQNFITKMRARSGTSSKINFGEWLQYYAFDVIGAITFTQTFGFLDAGSDYNNVVAGLEMGLSYGAVCGQVPAFHPWLFGNWQLMKWMKSIPALKKNNPVFIVHDMINQALRTIDSTPKDAAEEDFLTFMRKQADKNSSKMSETDMTNHMFVNLLAGSDTTAISLRAIFYYLLKHPRCMRKLTEQMYAADREGLLSPTITYAESQKYIPYLALVIKEALRLHPAVSLPLERIVPTEGLTLDGYTLPSRTIVGINAWVLHYDENVFGPDVNEFRPERWEENDDPAQIEKLKVMERSFFAFGHGSRTCIGKNISLLEMSKFVPQILREFKIDWAGNDEWSVNSSWFAKQSGVLVTFEERNGM